MSLNWIINRSFIDYDKHISCVLGFRNCNLDCDFCSNWKYTNLTYQEITLDHVRQIFETDPINDAVVMGGGEPSTDPFLMQEIIRLARINGLKIAVQTNGMLIHKIAQFDIDQFQIDLKLFLTKNTLARIIDLTRALIDQSKIKFTTVLFGGFDRDKLNFVCNRVKPLQVEGIIGQPDITRFPGKFKKIDKVELKELQNCISLRAEESTLAATQRIYHV